MKVFSQDAMQMYRECKIKYCKHGGQNQKFQNPCQSTYRIQNKRMKGSKSWNRKNSMHSGDVVIQIEMLFMLREPEFFKIKDLQHI